MDLPTRVQRSRIKGSKLPPGTICCTRPGPYGNPYVIGERSPGNHRIFMDRDHTLEYFEMWMECKDEARPGLLKEWLEPLRHAKHLACWCQLDERCHVDLIIVELAKECNT